MDKKMGMILGGVGVVVVIVLILTLSGGSSNWSSEAQKEYMDECVSNGADKKICECVMSALDSEYPNLPNWDNEKAQKEMEKMLTFGYNASLKCYNDLGIDLPAEFIMMDEASEDDGSIEMQ